MKYTGKLQYNNKTFDFTIFDNNKDCTLSFRNNKKVFYYKYKDIDELIKNMSRNEFFITKDRTLFTKFFTDENIINESVKFEFLITDDNKMIYNNQKNYPWLNDDEYNIRESFYDVFFLYYEDEIEERGFSYFIEDVQSYINGSYDSDIASLTAEMVELNTLDIEDIITLMNNENEWNLIEYYSCIDDESNELIELARKIIKARRYEEFQINLERKILECLK